MVKYPIFFLLSLQITLLQAQLAATYPHDLGIETDSSVLYVEMFEDGLDAIFSRYDDAKNPAGMSLAADVPSGSLGLASLKMTNLGGVNNGGHLYKRFVPGWDSVVYIRYYVKYPSSSLGYIHHEGVWLGGYNPPTPWPNPQAGACGLGDSRISIAYEPVGQTTMNTYLYWGGMRHDPNGNCWGNVMVKGDWIPPAVPFDQWLCVEIMVKLNNPVTATNGELRIWHDGVEVGYWGPGFPNGSWTWDKFIVDPAGPPFEGFRWRTDTDLNLNYIWIEFYDDQSSNGVSHYIQYDHLVMATQPIGPISDLTGLSTAPETEPMIKVHPNPATDKLTVAITDAGADISLFNLRGERVYTCISSFPTTTLDVSLLPSGIYILLIKSINKISTYKVIRQ